MEKIRLGKTGMMVTRVGFGGIPIQRVSEQEAVAIVRRCLDLGITFLDTANAYTTSEERIGKAIAGRREQVIVATKTASRKREGVEKHLKQSVERIGGGYIDLYQFHHVSDPASLEAVLDPKGPMAVVEEARKAGVVRHIGVTSHQIDTAKEAVRTGRFETIMFPFNFVAREPGEDLLALAREHDVGFIAMKPLAGGMLDDPRLAFKYLMQFPDVVSIPGIERVEEIEQIAGIVEGPGELSEAERGEMQRIVADLGSRFCRRCEYCQPCSEGIPISTVMVVGSAIKRLPPERLFVGMFADAVHKAASCTECGECEQRCPYHLPIREMIKEQTALFEQVRKVHEGSSGG